MSKAGQRKETTNVGFREPKLDTARSGRGIYFIDLEDNEFKENIGHARKNAGIGNGSSCAL